MILDDEYIILDGLCSFPWSDYGYRISATARNGLEGLEKLEQAKPDLILTDVKMPGMDGLDFAEKAHEIYPNAVIVILTGYDSFAYAQKAISIGVEEYLLKPVDYDELKAMAARIAGEIHARKEKQQEIRDLKTYFNRSVPQLRSKFAGNLLYGRIQGKGVVKEQAESLNLTIEKYIVCVGRKVVGENKIHTGDKWIEEIPKHLQSNFSHDANAVVAVFTLNPNQRVPAWVMSNRLPVRIRVNKIGAMLDPKPLPMYTVPVGKNENVKRSNRFSSDTNNHQEQKK